MLYHLFEHFNPDGLPYAYTSVLFRGTCAILLSFTLVLMFGPRTIRFLVRCKLGDQPEFDHASLNELMKDKAKIPTMGGILIIGAVGFCTFLLSDLTNYYVRMGFLCLLWLGILGGFDDWMKLSASNKTRDGLKMYEKMLFQIGLGVLLGFFVFRHGSNLVIVGNDVPDKEAFRVLAVPFYKHALELPRWMFIAITILVITWTSNAVNLTDGMDGLASGCTSMCSFFFMILAAVVGDNKWASALLIPHVPQSGELAVMCGAAMGACLGFLWYNCYPAKVFMGDAGSLPLGGLMGYVAIVTRQEPLLFIVGGVFVIEAMSVLLQVGYFKVTGGKRIFKVAPIHHHFHLSGWTETQTVTRFWLLSAIFAALALVTLKLR